MGWGPPPLNPCTQGGLRGTKKRIGILKPSRGTAPLSIDYKTIALLFMLTRHINCNIYKLNKYFIKLVLHSSKSLDSYKKSLYSIRNIILRIFKKYLKVSFVPICFQHLSWTNLAFLPCLYYGL